MIENDIHPPFVKIDRSQFVKTKSEKRAASLAKSGWKGTLITDINVNNLNKPSKRK
jgi:hypothetical protein